MFVITTPHLFFYDWSGNETKSFQIRYVYSVRWVDDDDWLAVNVIEKEQASLLNKIAFRFTALGPKLLANSNQIKTGSSHGNLVDNWISDQY